LPVEASPELVERLRAALPEQPVVMRRRLRAEWGFSDVDFQAIVNAGLLVEVADTVATGVEPVAARKWWMGELSRIANERGVEPGSLVTPEAVSALQALVDSGRLTDKLARAVLAGMVDGEGTPEEIVQARGLEVVSDDGALTAAIDEALAAQPDVLEKIREGKTQAAGAVIGAVMKAMGGQADAARVRELVIERANATA
jgi:aspartyl-tRNA(Asn)/glutamyl-tRNA(Gln) amidotransferase subunit B